MKTYKPKTIQEAIKLKVWEQEENYEKAKKGLDKLRGLRP